MSHFLMFVPTKATAKPAHGNTGHEQVIGIILCCSPNCPIIYPVGQVYYCTGHPSNTIKSGSLKLYVGSQKVTSEPLEHYKFVDLQGRSWRSTYQAKKNPLPSSNIIFQSQPSKIQEYCCTNCICTFKTKSLSDYSSAFWSRLYYQTKTNGNKRTHGRSPSKYP